jgi:EAL domain-containing protein (putative c-di-GMP-specific phosphodiesterase class I)
VDSIKIDRSMIKGVDKGPENTAVASASISLAHALGLEVVTEGVESAGERNKLRSLGCDFGQGYYWGRPCSAKRRRSCSRSIVTQACFSNCMEEAGCLY